MTTIRLVCATRVSQDSFFTQTSLGKCWRLCARLNIELRLFDKNLQGLPVVYNQAIREAQQAPAILAFIHDDVYFTDSFWPQHLITGLQRFQILGLAGNRRRLPRQPSWAFIDEQFTWDAPENLSGVVGHGKEFLSQDISHYGPSMVEVKLLDGLFLAAHSQILHEKQLMFDEQFDFHFYDMDFCRQAEAKGLILGTCPISVVHESGGAFGRTDWRESYAKYLAKWGS